MPVTWISTRGVSALAALSLAVSSCATASLAPVIPRPDSDSVPASATTSTTAAPTTTTSLPEPTADIEARPPRAIVDPCPVHSATPPPIGGDAVEASVETAHSLVCAATDLVVAPAGGNVTGAVRAAAALGAPLVYGEAERPYDPSHLGVARVWTPDPALVSGGPHSVLPLPDEDAEVTPLAAAAGDGEITNTEVTDLIGSASPAETLVVVSTEDPALGAVASATAEAIGGQALWAAPGDMRRRRSLSDLAQESTNRRLVGNFSGASAWQLDTLADAPQLPGGGHILFPGKRLVALYGHPHTPGLGVLGEQPLDEAVTRAAEVAAEYQTDDGPTVVPTFEIITTTASSGAGADGDYSAELSVEDLRPWVEAAGEAGYYVILDLQPGRTDFLTQAKRYEELLHLPHVGLALDPEWRLASDQFHLRQIGSVTAEEVNQVATWLAEMVRSQRLPQKLLVIHQFKLSMITQREDIATPPELAVVIQMDGQGPLGTKYGTWNAMLQAGEGGWRWGWKNFYDEDSPMATPGQVLDLDPLPVFISYQ